MGTWSSNRRMQLKVMVRCAVPAIALALAACSSEAEPRDMPDAGMPRVVSLNPCIDAVLVEVAEPGQILALSHYSRDPASSSIAPETAARFAVTGGTVEEVLSLEPDMVLAGSFMAPSTWQALSDLGVNVVTFGIASTPEASFAQLRAIATLLQREDRGEALIARIEAALSASAAPEGAVPLSAVLWQPGQIVPGEATLVSALMQQAGFTSHSSARGLGQADYLTLEAMLADAPDVLLVAGDAPAQRHPVLERLQGTRIEAFDPALIYCGGPTMIRASQRLAEIRKQAA